MYPKKLQIITAPNVILNQTSIVVEKIDNNTLEFMDLMLDLMYENSGIGLSAVQVGILERIFCMDTTNLDQNNLQFPLDEPIFCINPEIISFSDTIICYEEGCLSVPRKTIKINRYEEINVSFLNHHGEKQQLTLDGINAVCFQHELDHLNGITILEK